MCVVGFLVGWRIGTDVLGLLGALAHHPRVRVLAVVGVRDRRARRVRDAETAQAVSFPILAPLVFASSAFVPVATMPGWLQAWAEHQPVSVGDQRGARAHASAARRHRVRAQGDRLDRRHHRRLRAARRPRVPQTRLTPLRHRSDRRSRGKGSCAMARTARRTSSSGLSSAEVRFRSSSSQPVQRCTSSHSPSPRTAMQQRLHERAAVHGAVAGSVVEVAAPQTLWAVVAMARPRRERRDAGAAMAAGERARRSGTVVLVA